MNVHYKIVEVWPQDHMIVVRYWTDVISEEFLSINNIRKEDGSPERCRTDTTMTLSVPPPVDKELEDFIMSRAPIPFLKTLEDIDNPDVDTSMKDILPLANKKFTKQLDVKQDVSALKELSEEEIEKLIEQVTSQ